MSLARDIVIAKAFGGGGGGGGGGVLVVNVTDEGVCDKTWQEIHDAFTSTGVVFSIEGNLNVCAAVGFNSLVQKYYVTVSDFDYFAATVSDFPVRDES